jgi:tetratricopeptide (TPR) repeat protein
MCHARKKEWEPALKCLRKAGELDPENRQFSHNLGYCLARSGRYEESLACFTKTDGEAKAHYNLARMLHHMQQDDLSRQYLRTAVEKDPYLIPAKELLAQLENGVAAPREVVPTGHEASDVAPQGSALPFPTGSQIE